MRAVRLVLPNRPNASPERLQFVGGCLRDGTWRGVRGSTVSPGASRCHPRTGAPPTGGRSPGFSPRSDPALRPSFYSPPPGGVRGGHRPHGAGRHRAGPAIGYLAHFPRRRQAVGDDDWFVADLDVFGNGTGVVVYRTARGAFGSRQPREASRRRRGGRRGQPLATCAGGRLPCGHGARSHGGGSSTRRR